jgi:hypothetical protein
LIPLDGPVTKLPNGDGVESWPANARKRNER